jgi:hypothetical protein
MPKIEEQTTVLQIVNGRNQLEQGVHVNRFNSNLIAAD